MGAKEHKWAGDPRMLRGSAEANTERADSGKEATRMRA